MNKKLTINHITKVEGHGKLYIDVKNNEVKCVQMEIFEGARYFEALVLNRHYSEAAEITSRICGICSQSHLLCALQAIEDAMKVKVSEQTETLREIIMLASLLQSHVLHLYFLALPEYLGYDNALQMASKHKAAVARALKLKRLANDIVMTVGGREIHSIRPTVGGFYRVPTAEELNALHNRLREAKTDIEETVKLFLSLNYPSFSRKTQYLAIRNKNKIDYLKGNLISDSGVTSTPDKYLKVIKESIESYSNTKCVMLKDREFMVGSLARVNVNKSLLSHNTKKILTKSKIKFPSSNPYHNNAAQAVEVMDFYDRLLPLLKYKPVEEKLAEIKVRAGRGVSVIEAPRGLLFHEYTIDAEGRITHANIIAPTTQNLKNIEEDVKILLPGLMKKSEQVILNETEKLIRAYDPCISCSTHFLEIIWR